MESLERKLRYSFHDRELLSEALNHSSYANEHRSGLSSNFWATAYWALWPQSSCLNAMATCRRGI